MLQNFEDTESFFINLLLKKYPFLTYPLVTFFFFICFFKISEAFRSFLSLFVKKPEKIFFDKDFFGNAANPRFGFAFIYPKTWDRQDPTNADGNKYINPKNKEIELSFWGSYLSLYENEGNFKEKFVITKCQAPLSYLRISLLIASRICFLSWINLTKIRTNLVIISISGVRS